MTAKEYLNQAREIDALIHSKLRELDYWRDLSRRISGSHFEEQHNPNRPSDAPFARCICKIDELERDISHMVDEYVDLQKSVSQAIDCVENNQEKLLLRYRYIDGRTWQKIAELLDVSLRTWVGSPTLSGFYLTLAHFDTPLPLWHIGWWSMIESAKMYTAKSLRGRFSCGGFLYARRR